MKQLLLFFFLFSLTTVIHAQSFVCGTELTDQQIKQIKDELAYNKPGFTTPDICLKKEVSIYALIVRDSMINPGVTLAQINSGIDIANKYFAPICLSFKICKVIYIDNFNYDDFVALKHEKEIVNLYCTPNVINVLFTKSVTNNQNKVVGGYAELGISLPTNPKDIILCQKSGVENGRVLTHEFGHFFGLYHTFEVGLGKELVDASNCSTTGDLLCDTEADIESPPMVGCQYTGNSKDLANNFHTPPIGNVMAYHGSCVCKFTTGQYNRMVWSFLNCRKYLL